VKDKFAKALIGLGTVIEDDLADLCERIGGSIVGFGFRFLSTDDHLMTKSNDELDAYIELGEMNR
jgi:hypothetical protein